MARFRTRISLHHIHCYKQGEIFGSEPYLWTAFFKIDGDTIVVDLDAGGVFLNGPCTFVATTSSHGNLDDTDVHEGDDVSIPPTLGELEFTVTTFRKAERLGSDDTNARGAVGVVVALIEEESSTDSDVARGRAQFNKELEDGINRIIPTLRMETNFEPQPKDVVALRERVADEVESAVFDGLRSFLRNFFAGDKVIGTEFFLASETEIIDKRFQRTVEVQVQDLPPPLPPRVEHIITHDYGLVGEIQWFEAAPIFWHHDQTGETQIWFMNEHQLARRATVLGEDGQPTFIGPPFRIVGVGDMDGDGQADIVCITTRPARPRSGS